MKTKVITSLMLVALLGTPILADEESPKPVAAPPPLEMSSKLTLNPTGSPPDLEQPAPIAPTLTEAALPASKPNSKFLLIATALGLGALLGGGLGRQLGWRRGVRLGQVNADHQVSELQHKLASAQDQIDATTPNQRFAQTKQRDHNKSNKKTQDAGNADDAAKWQTTISTFERDVRDKNTLIDQLRDKLTVAESESTALSQSIDTSNTDHQTTLDALRSEHSKALAATEQDLTQQYEQLKQTSDATVAELSAEHAKASDAQRVENERLVAGHQEALDTLHSEHSKALAAKELELTQQTEQLKQARDTSTAELNEQHEKATQAQRVEYERLVADHQKALDALHKEHREDLAAKEQKLTQQSRALKKSRDATVAELDAQHTKVTDAQRIENERLAKECKSLSEEHKSLSEELEQARLAQRTLQTQLVTTHDTSTKSDQKIIHLTELTEKQSKQHEKLTSVLATAESTVTELTSKLAAAEKRATEVSFKHDAAATPMQKQIDILQSELATRDTDARAMVNELEALRKQTFEVDELRATLAKRDEALAAAQSELASLDIATDELAQLTGRYNLLDQQAQQDAAERIEANDRLLGLADVIENHDSLQLEHTKLTRERDQLAEALKDLEANVAASTASIEASQRNSSDLEQQLNQALTREQTADDEREALKQQIDALQNSADEKAGAVSQLNQNVITLQSERDELLQQLSASQQLMESESSDHNHVVDELTRQTHDLESELKRLTSQHTHTEQEAAVTHEQLEKITSQLASRDSRLKELAKEHKSSSAALTTALAESKTANEMVTKLNAQVSELETKLKDKADQVSERVVLDQSSRDERNRQLDQMERAMNDANSRAQDLELQTEALREEIDSRKAHSVELNAELIDLRADRESQRRNIVDLHARLHKEHDGDSSARELEEAHAALDQREALVGTLENQLNRAVRYAEELQESIENMQLETAAEEDKSETVKSNGTKPDKISPELVVRMQKQMKAQIARIRKLENEVKVHSDLVKVLESDSTQLHNTETRYEEVVETAAFLQKELTAAVTENRVLREQLEKSAKQLARHQNIGRSLDDGTVEHQQLLSRVAALEAENQELIQSLESDA